MVALSALTLVGCAGGGEGDPAPTPDGTATSEAATLPPGDELPVVAEGEGTPAMQWPETGPPAGLEVEVLVEGDGAEVGVGAAVLADYAGYVWGSDAAFDDSFSRGAPSMFSLNSVIAGWTDGIPGATVGSRLLISVPPDLGYGPSGGNEAADIGAEDTIVFVVDVEETYNADVTGSADAAPVGEDLPVELTGALGEPASIAVPEDAEEPAEATLYGVSEGDGEPVGTGESVAIAYAVAYWDGSEAQSSWTAGSETAGPLVAAIGQGTVFDLLDGVAVGSRVVLTAPATESGPAFAVVADVLGSA